MTASPMKIVKIERVDIAAVLRVQASCEIPGTECTSAANRIKERSEICYFMGLKSEQRGRFCDAADWYLTSVESGQLNNIESRWAVRRLRQWVAEGTRRDRLSPSQAPVFRPSRIRYEEQRQENRRHHP